MFIRSDIIMVTLDVVGWTIGLYFVCNSCQVSSLLAQLPRHELPPVRHVILVELGLLQGVRGARPRLGGGRGRGEGGLGAGLRGRGQPRPLRPPPRPRLAGPLLAVLPPVHVQGGLALVGVATIVTGQPLTLHITSVTCQAM